MSERRKIKDEQFPIIWTVYHTVIVFELAIIVGIQIAVLSTLLKS